jgi:hypothetical protein
VSTGPPKRKMTFAFGRRENKMSECDQAPGNGHGTALKGGETSEGRRTRFCTAAFPLRRDVRATTPRHIRIPFPNFGTSFLCVATRMLNGAFVRVFFFSAVAPRTCAGSLPLR